MHTERLDRAIRMVVKNRKVAHVEGNLYSVESESIPGKRYQVSITDTCSCPDFQRRGLPCKHIMLALMSVEA